MTNSINNKVFVALPILLFIVYYVIILSSGLDNHMIIHDNLDGELLFRIMINYPEGSELYSDGIINTVQNGIPRSALPTSLNLTSFIFSLFSPWLAYFINDVIARVVGFVGFSLLLNRLLRSNRAYRNWTILITSSTFALLGSYNIYNGLTFMGIPLLIYIFYNIINGKTYLWYYIATVIFAFSSHLSLIGIFVLIALGIWWIIDIIQNRKINWHATILIGILTLSYIIVEHKMILLYFSGDFISHRTEWCSDLSFIRICYEVINRVFITQYHGGSLYSISIIILCLYSYYQNKKLSNNIKWLLCIVFSIATIDVIYLLVTNYLGVLNSFQLNRFYFFYPTVWLLIMAFACEDILGSTRRRDLFKVAICFSMMLLALLSSAYKNQELQYNIRNVTSIKSPSSPSYNQFYDTQLFNRIKEYIGKNQNDYKVISCGLYPSIALFNGFFTLDAYLVMYPLPYKHKFREIISGELDKDHDLKSYFDNWGSRCYMFVADNRDCTSANINDISIEQLDINTSALVDMGCEYIFSKYKIENATDINLSLEMAFDGLYWRIYLYKINN